MLYSKYDPCGRSMEAQGFLAKTWKFQTPDYDKAYKFYNFLCGMYIPPYEIFEIFDISEHFDFIEGRFVYTVVFDCNERLRTRLEYVYRRIINSGFTTSDQLLLGLTDDYYSIERIQ